MKIDRLDVQHLNRVIDTREELLRKKITLADTGWQDFAPIRSSDWTAGTLRVARWRLFNRMMSVRFHERAFTVSGTPAYVTIRIPNQAVALSECLASMPLIDTVDNPPLRDASLAIALSGDTFIRLYRSADLVELYDADAGVHSAAFAIDIEVVT